MSPSASPPEAGPPPIRAFAEFRPPLQPEPATVFPRGPSRWAKLPSIDATVRLKRSRLSTECSRALPFDGTKLFQPKSYPVQEVARAQLAS